MVADYRMNTESIWKMAERILGSSLKAEGWMNKRVPALGNEKPITLINSEEGRQRIYEVLHKIETGDFS